MNLGTGFDVLVSFILMIVLLLIALGVSFAFNISWLSALGIVVIVLLAVILSGNFIHSSLNKFKRRKGNDKK